LFFFDHNKPGDDSNSSDVSLSLISSFTNNNFSSCYSTSEKPHLSFGSLDPSTNDWFNVPDMESTEINVDSSIITTGITGDWLLCGSSSFKCKSVGYAVEIMKEEEEKPIKIIEGDYEEKRTNVDKKEIIISAKLNNGFETAPRKV
jgi:expansin (peptidoglycan-binding protein)